MISIIALIISGISTTSAIVFAIISANKNSKRETENKATSIAVLNSDMGYVKSGIDDIKNKQKDLDDNLGSLNTRVTQAEDSAKSAHHRIDMHEERISKLEHE